MTKKPIHILLFDGDCYLCNTVVKFVIKIDKKSKIQFASLQSNVGTQILAMLNLPTTGFTSIVYYTNYKAYTKSSAILTMLKDIGYFWKLFYILICIPAPIRNFTYNIISKNRFKLFGYANKCILPTPEIAKRFL